MTLQELTLSPPGEAASIVKAQTVNGLRAVARPASDHNLGPRQLAYLRRTIPAFKELEARSRRARGEFV